MLSDSELAEVRKWLGRDFEYISLPAATIARLLAAYDALFPDNRIPLPSEAETDAEPPPRPPFAPNSKARPPRRPK